MIPWWAVGADGDLGAWSSAPASQAEPGPRIPLTSGTQMCSLATPGPWRLTQAHGTRFNIKTHTTHTRKRQTSKLSLPSPQLGNQRPVNEEIISRSRHRAPYCRHSKGTPSQAVEDTPIFLMPGPHAFREGPWASLGDHGFPPTHRPAPHSLLTPGSEVGVYNVYTVIKNCLSHFGHFLGDLSLIFMRGRAS